MNKKRKPSKLDLENALRKNLKKENFYKKKLQKKMILNDKQITKLAEQKQMISPFVKKYI